MVVDDGSRTKTYKCATTVRVRNIVEWVYHFNIYAKPNGWNNDTKAVKLPTLLEGEALAVWLDLMEEQ